MRINDLLSEYYKLAPADQAAFAGIVRSHQMFNIAEWCSEIARRHSLLDSAPGLSPERVERLVKEREARSASMR